MFLTGIIPPLPSEKTLLEENLMKISMPHMPSNVDSIIKCTSMHFTQKFEFLSFIERSSISTSNILNDIMISLDLGSVRLLWNN